MIAIAIERSLAQINDPAFRRVFMRAVIVSILVLTVLLSLIYVFWPPDWNWGFDLLDGVSFVVVAVVMSYFLFPALATMVMNAQLEQVAGAVEQRYYPQSVGAQSIPLMDVVMSGLALLAKAILINLLALPFYLFLLVTGGIGSLLLALVINGYLLGREYFELVALRHMGRKEMRLRRAEQRGNWMLGGAIIAGLFMIPLVNLLAPIVGAALMTHIYHDPRTSDL